MLQTIDLCVTDVWFTVNKAMVYAFKMTCFLTQREVIFIISAKPSRFIS